MPKPLSPGKRESLLRSMISSQALEGVYVSYEEAERALDEALSMPLVTIG
jgi:hypothetical protein